MYNRTAKRQRSSDQVDESVQLKVFPMASLHAYAAQFVVPDSDNVVMGEEVDSYCSGKAFSVVERSGHASDLERNHNVNFAPDQPFARPFVTKKLDCYPNQPLLMIPVVSEENFPVEGKLMCTVESDQTSMFCSDMPQVAFSSQKSLPSVGSKEPQVTEEPKIRLVGDEEGTLVKIISRQSDGGHQHQPSEDELSDLRGPYKVQHRIHLVVQKWGTVTPIPPDKFLLKLLNSRGYDATMQPASEIRRRRQPSPKQVEDYDNEMVTAIRSSDLNRVKTLCAGGRSMSACNRFSESIVHMACRRSDLEVVDFILRNGGDLEIVDDYGRTPLHDACWRPEPRFDVVTLLLDRDTSLLRMLDVRGSNPLNYVRQEHWLHWCAYIFHQKDKYWPLR